MESAVSRLRLSEFIHKRGIMIAFILLAALSVIIAGTYAWLSIVQRATNEFAFEPYDVKLIKRDGVTGLPIPGVAFRLYYENGVPKGEYTTGVNGEITVYHLNEGENYYFKEEKAAKGYYANDTEYRFTAPHDADIVAYNNPKPSTLSVSKKIGETDLYGDNYNRDNDLDLQFEFTVNIDNETNPNYNPDKEYHYTIYKEDGTNLDGTSNLVPTGDGGTIKSGDKIYLRHAETAVFDGILSHTPYVVAEKDYFEVYDEAENHSDDDGDGYGCADEDTYGHSRVFAKARGWASFADDDSGSILPPENGGSLARFENRKVPEDYEVTMSSLVVVDRIIANSEDIDPAKAFEVTIEVGEDKNQQYYYEVVHIDDTMNTLPGYDHEYDYYNRNDPTPEYGTGKLGDAVWPPYRDANPLYARAVSCGLPVSYAAPDNNALHYPHDNERWPRTDNTYPLPSISNGNIITVNLHHSSAIVVYGIPTGTRYKARQVDYRYIDGYMIDRTIKTEGHVLPDLNVIKDDDPYSQDNDLLRVRADIYNYFVLPIRTIDVEKKWNHGDNPSQYWPVSTVVHVVDKDSNLTFDSRELRSIDNWAASLNVPKYNADGTLIDYRISEEMPPDYVITDISGCADDGFVITNTYAPATVKPAVEKIITGSPPSTASFTFEINSVTENAPMPDSNTVTVTGEGNAFFDNIKFDTPGTYVYEISERRGDAAGYTYDSSVYVMTVTVTQDGNGKCTVSCEYTKKGEASAFSVFPLPFTNEYNPVQTSSLIVRKTVTGSGADKNKLFTFTADIGGTKHTFTLKDGESKAFTGIPAGTSYTVTEDDYYPQGYITSSSNSAGTIPVTGVTAMFTNTKTNFEQSDEGSLTVRKYVEGADADSGKEFRFTVTIGGDKHVFYLRDGKSETFDGIPAGTRYSVREDSYSGYATTSSKASGTITKSSTIAAFTNISNSEKDKSTLSVTKTVRGEGADRSKRFDFTVTIGRFKYKITLADGEKYTFTNIPVGTSYSVSETGYAAAGYTATSTGTSGTISKAGNIAAFVNTSGGTQQSGNGSLIITKTVSGRFVDTTKKFRFTAKIGQKEHVFFLRHGESQTFTGIAPGTSYTVTEDDYYSQDYVTYSKSASGTMTAAGANAAFVNEYVGETFPKPDDDAVQISGKKTWVHGTNTNYPQSITVFVMNGSSIVTRKVVTAKENWSYAFNLPKYDSNGKQILYSVNEDTVKKYVKSINGYDLTNTYDPSENPGTGDGKIMWIWFIVLVAGSVGLRYAVFYKNKRRENK